MRRVLAAVVVVSVGATAFAHASAQPAEQTAEVQAALEPRRAQPGPHPCRRGRLSGRARTQARGVRQRHHHHARRLRRDEPPRDRTHAPDHLHAVDREEVPAELVGTDPLSDIAVLKLTPPKPRMFRAATFGDSSKLDRGQTVLAMGSPLALSQSVTLGIVSNTEMIMPQSGRRKTARRRRRRHDRALDRARRRHLSRQLRRSARQPRRARSSASTRSATAWRGAIPSASRARSPTRSSRTAASSARGSASKSSRS